MKVFREQRGNVTVEFVGVIVALLIPVMFIAVSCVGVVRTYLVQDAAANSAVRGFTISQNELLANARARAVVATVLRDHHMSSKEVNVLISCTQRPCLQVRAVVTVTVQRPFVVQVLGPWLSRTVLVSATHSAMVDVGRA